MKTLEGKVIVITGASSGIGAATARRVLNEGAKVALLARREERLQEIAAEYPADNVLVLVADVTDTEAIQQAIDKVLDTFGRVDVLFNNAGIMPQAPLTERRVDEWRHMIDVNIMGVLNGISAVLPTMQAQKSGHIISTDSVSGHVVSEGGVVYAGTKFAVRAIMDGIRLEERENGIKSTIISPGTVNTELHTSIVNSEKRAFIEKLQQEVGLTAEEVAEAVYFAINTSSNNVISEVIMRPITQRD